MKSLTRSPSAWANRKHFKTVLAHPSKFLALVAMLLAAIGAGLFHQRLVTAELSREARSLRAEERELSSLQAEHDQLTAAMVPSDEASTRPNSRSYSRSA